MAAGGIVALGGCKPEKRALGHIEPGDEDSRLLNRFGFGPTVESLAEVKAKGAKSWFSEQLDAPLDEPPGLALKLMSLPMSNLSAWELRDWPEKDVLRQLQMAAILRAVESPWQLRERMVHFWTDHFNIFGRKGLGAFRKPLDEKQVVRANALSSFPAILKASARSTAMLLYLDQQASNAQHPNENYGRELLELHTLGVNGGYTQDDVMQVARCFTGWTEERGFLKRKGEFKFDASLHDPREKHVLGHKIPAGGGIGDGERVLEIVANHPSTVEHVSHKLCRWFLGDDGTKVEPRVRSAWRSSHGDIKSLLRVIFESGVWSSGAPIVKRPFDYIVSSLRALQARTDADSTLQEHLAAMGQPLYQWPMPDGYPVDTEAWTGSLLARWNFAFALCEGSIKGTAVPEFLAVEAAYSPFLGTVSRDDQNEVLITAAKLENPRHRLAACLCSPHFQWR